MKRLFVFSLTFSVFSVVIAGVSALAAVPAADVFVKEQVLSHGRLEVQPLSELSAELSASQEVFMRELHADIARVVAELRANDPAAVSSRLPAAD